MNIRENDVTKEIKQLDLRIVNKKKESLIKRYEKTK